MVIAALFVTLLLALFAFVVALNATVDLKNLEHTSDATIHDLFDIRKCAEAAHARVTKAERAGGTALKDLKQHMERTDAYQVDRIMRGQELQRQRMQNVEEGASLRWQAIEARLRNFELGMVAILRSPSKASKDFLKTNKQFAAAQKAAGAARKREQES